MAVYVDKMQLKAKVRGRWGIWSHMVADTEAELDVMATKLKLKLSYKQDPETMNVSMLHYDVEEEKRQEAIRLGAIELERSEFVRKVHEIRANGYNRAPRD